MKKAGMIVAVEMDAVDKKYGAPCRKIIKAGYEIEVYDLNNYELFVLHTGAGEIAAAAGTQLLISEFHVDIIFNFGIVGGLTSEISERRICVVKDVVHYDFDTSASDHCEVGRYLTYPSVFLLTTQELVEKVTQIVPKIAVVRCASGDKFIADPVQKKKLHEDFGADICEMEAAGIVLTCDRNEVPCLLIKMVADGLHGGAEEFHEVREWTSDVCLDVMDQVLRQI